MNRVVSVFIIIHILPIFRLITQFQYSNNNAIILSIIAIINFIFCIYIIKTKNEKIKKFLKLYLIYLLLYLIFSFSIESYKEPFTFNEDGSVREYTIENIYGYTLDIR